MTLSIILPTVRGREASYQAVRDAYEATSPEGTEIITPRDFPVVGLAWNAGAAEAKGAVLHFAIDDAVPHPGWFEAGMRILERGALPSPRLVTADGMLEACGSMGGGMFMPDCPEGTPCRSGGILLVPRGVWETVGEFAPIHYYCDDDWCWRAALAGAPMVACPGYCFTHSHHLVRRRLMQDRSGQDRLVFLERAASAGVLAIAAADPSPSTEGSAQPNTPAAPAQGNRAQRRQAAKAGRR